MEAEQVLDKLKVEQDRGITVKAQTSSLVQNIKGEDYLINLVDTPGHSDFAYEVERSLKACEGALLVVDSAQGIQAQTMAHYKTSENIKDQEREIFGDWIDFDYIPVMNKCDLPGADPELTELQVAITMGVETDKGAVYCSAKTGEGVEYLLERIASDIKPPKPLDWGYNEHLTNKDELRCFVFDSWFEPNRGVYFLVRVFNGDIKKGDKVLISKMVQKKTIEVREVGIMNPNKLELEHLSEGQVGYVLLNLKDPAQSAKNLGATIIREDKLTFEGEGHEINNLRTEKDNFNLIKPIPEMIKPKQMIYASLYPELPDEYTQLNVAINKLLLEDPAVSITKESSPALGNGFRCGFLGSLHMECFKQRIEDEFDLGCITTFPTVVYQAMPRGGDEPVEVYNPLEAPEHVTEWLEPWAEAKILCPLEYFDNIKRVCENRRGLLMDFEDTDDGQFLVTYEFPMSEIITDFVDVVKTNSKGYASLDYEFLEYRTADIEKVVIYITNEPIDALSFLVHKRRAFELGKKICIKLKELVPRQLFNVKIQARIRNKTIASESIQSTGKNVLAKCYGGDYSRKRKLIEKQKAGKKKMRELGRVSVPTTTLNKIFQ